MTNKKKETTKTTVEYVAIAKSAYKDYNGDIIIKKGDKCKLKKLNEEKYKKTGTVNFVKRVPNSWWGGCAVYKNIASKVKKITTTTKVTTITEVTEEEI